MTTMVFHQQPAARRGSHARLRAAFAAYLGARRRRREERVTLTELSGFDKRRLRDLGIDPLDLYDAMHGRRQASALFEPVRQKRE